MGNALPRMDRDKSHLHKFEITNSLNTYQLFGCQNIFYGHNVYFEIEIYCSSIIYGFPSKCLDIGIRYFGKRFGGHF